MSSVPTTTIVRYCNGASEDAVTRTVTGGTVAAGPPSGGVAAMSTLAAAVISVAVTMWRCLWAWGLAVITVA